MTYVPVTWCSDGCVAVSLQQRIADRSTSPNFFWFPVLARGLCEPWR